MKTKGAKDKNPGGRIGKRSDKIEWGKTMNRIPNNDRTELVSGRISPAARDYLVSFGRHLNWGERIERAVQTLIRADKEHPDAE